MRYDINYDDKIIKLTFIFFVSSPISLIYSLSSTILRASLDSSFDFVFSTYSPIFLAPSLLLYLGDCREEIRMGVDEDQVGEGGDEAVEGDDVCVGMDRGVGEGE